MPFYRQNARFDPEGRLSPRCAIPRLPVRHKYISPASVLQLGHRIGIAVVPYRNSTPPSPASIDRRHNAFDPVDQSAAGWGTGRRRLLTALERGNRPSAPSTQTRPSLECPVRWARPRDDLGAAGSSRLLLSKSHTAVVREHVGQTIRTRECTASVRIRTTV
jgi:hypothetical protein